VQQLNRPVQPSTSLAGTQARPTSQSLASRQLSNSFLGDSVGGMHKNDGDSAPSGKHDQPGRPLLAQSCKSGSQRAMHSGTVSAVSIISRNDLQFSLGPQLWVWPGSQKVWQ